MENKLNLVSIIKNSLVTFQWNIAIILFLAFMALKIFETIAIIAIQKRQIKIASITTMIVELIFFIGALSIISNVLYGLFMVLGAGCGVAITLYYQEKMKS